MTDREIAKLITEVGALRETIKEMGSMPVSVFWERDIDLENIRHLGVLLDKLKREISIYSI